MKAQFKIFFAVSVFAVLFNVDQAFAGDISFGRYHSQDEIQAYLKSSAAKSPALVTFKNLGQSEKGRPIDYVIVSNGSPKGKPAIYFNGTHHGDEWSSTEGILALIDSLITRASEPAIRAILDRYAIYLQPLVNPDGHKKQTREDSIGRDLNRDYSSPLRPDNESFAAVETQLVKKLVDEIRPVAAAAYHSGIEEVLWSWCYTDRAAKDAARLSLIGEKAAQAMGMDRYLQSYEDYPTDGEFIDYAYSKYGTVALTFEVSNEKIPQPADLQAVVDRSVAGAIALIQNVSTHDTHSWSETSVKKSYGRLGSSPWKSRRRLE